MTYGVTNPEQIVLVDSFSPQNVPSVPSRKPPQKCQMVQVQATGANGQSPASNGTKSFSKCFI